MAWKNLKQLGLVDGFLIEHKALTEFDEVNALIDWARIENFLSNIHAKPRGEKSWPPVMIFKALLLQSWYVGANPASKVRNAVRDDARVTKVETVKPAPLPLEYVDLGSGETNGHLTPGNIGTVNGNRLKFDPAKADEGVFLIPSKDGEKETRITGMQKNKPGQLVFLIPGNLAKGNYRMVVRARMDGSSELRSGYIEATLRA
uniref:Uncharacterized protein n=1 Tax=Candidatus Kentrum sp. LPFa TaxID=2126335 RepID=A0A450VU01_9GAMM|nr:MAG: protein of unknown function (DUF4469) with IG-like fold [Candidatus Kentron sp. LPFa]